MQIDGIERIIGISINLNILQLIGIKLTQNNKQVNKYTLYKTGNNKTTIVVVKNTSKKGRQRIYLFCDMETKRNISNQTK